MNQELKEELDFTTEMLVKSGFFNQEEILEILEEQFIEENIDVNELDINITNSSDDSTNFNSLEEAFLNLTKKDIVAIHNCGYDIKEGVNDAFELFIHLRNNKLNPKGFCFYTFEDIEEAIVEGKLKITFGDFEEDENKCLEIGNIVFDELSSFDNFDVSWDGTVNNQIEIKDFNWDKKYDPQKEYEMEGSFEEFFRNH